jgi:hypothetical protein
MAIHQLQLYDKYFWSLISWQMNIGIIQPYSNGFLEVVPEGEGSDYWHIAAIHINGKAFCPSPKFYRSEQVALTKAAKIYDWIADHEQEISDGSCYCSELKLILWYQPKAS